RCPTRMALALAVCPGFCVKRFLVRGDPAIRPIRVEGGIRVRWSGSLALAEPPGTPSLRSVSLGRAEGRQRRRAFGAEFALLLVFLYV
ncbi:MAG: hypothetical protein ACREDR_43215, partial [Blastocatellia bacterium]